MCFSLNGCVRGFLPLFILESFPSPSLSGKKYKGFYWAEIKGGGIPTFVDGPVPDSNHSIT